MNRATPSSITKVASLVPPGITVSSTGSHPVDAAKSATTIVSGVCVSSSSSSSLILLNKNASPRPEPDKEAEQQHAQ